MACLVAGLLTFRAGAQSTAFTYQGELKVNNALANGLHDFRFRLFDAASGGTQLGSQVCADNVAIVDGKFGVMLDFGQQFASPQSRFIEIEVRTETGLSCGSAAGFMTLVPRQQLTAAPRALHARSAFALDAPDGSPANAVFVDNNGDVGIGTTTPNLLNYGNSVLSLGGARPRLEFQGSSTTSQNLGIVDFLNGNTGVAALVVIADPATNSAHVNLHTKSLWLTGGNSSGLPASEGAGLRLYHTAGSDHAHIFAYDYANPTPQNLALQQPGGNVGIGTAAPAAKLGVRGDIRLGNTGQLLASGGAENLRIVRGLIEAGTNLGGAGFTVTDLGVGKYRINFSPAFSGLPAVSIMSSFDDGSTNHYWRNLSSDSVEIHMFANANYEDATFTFIAIGPR